ncbi:flagellar basal body-associated FliL family protein [bacterium]|nr:flagellar basal body-associated FliL family protein [bacterium]
MADEEENNEEAEATPGEEKKPGSKKLLFIIGGVVLLIFLIATPIVLFTVMGGGDDEIEKEDADAAEDQEELVLLLEGFHEEDEAKEDEKPLGAFYPFETFVVNLSGGGYLRCQAVAEFEKRDIPKKFYSKIIPVRDSLINVLSNKSRRDLGDEEGRADLKAEMRDLINEEIRKAEVKRIYFTQFVIQ